jgi:hypothetical protein
MAIRSFAKRTTNTAFVNVTFLAKMIPTALNDRRTLSKDWTVMGGHNNN